MNGKISSQKYIIHIDMLNEYITGEMMSSIVMGVSTSLTSAAIFLFILSRFRPKISISPIVVKEKRVDGRLAYVIKVINKTKYPLINCNIELKLIKERRDRSGKFIKENINVEMNISTKMLIEKFSKTSGYNTIMFLTYQDIESIWPDNDNGHSYLRFRIYAKHELSGFAQVYTQEYYGKDTCIINGSFKFGNTFDVYS